MIFIVRICIYKIKWAYDRVIGIWYFYTLYIDYIHDIQYNVSSVIIRSFVCNTKRPSVKQSIKWQACSNFQISRTLRQADPPPFETVSDGQSIGTHIANLCVQWDPIQNGHCSSFMLKFTHQVSSPQVSSLLLKFTLQVYPPIWNCSEQQNMYWLSYVWREYPFKTVIFITALHCVIWCWAIGEVSHTCITDENEAIYVNCKFFIVVLLCLWFHVVVVVGVQNHTCTTTTSRTTTKRLRIKMIHVNWSFCSHWCFISIETKRSLWTKSKTQNEFIFSVLG